MKCRGVKTFTILSCIVMFAGGCAKQGVVKSDEPLTPRSADSMRNRQEAVKTAPTVEAAADGPRTGSAAAGERSSLQIPEPIPNTAELKAAMERIYFNFDSYALSASARESLVKNSTIMKSNPAASVRIEGNCDERGSDEYNLALGEKRAKEAMQYLKTLGISEKRLTVISYGKEKPLAQGHDETAWGQNRRDDFVMFFK